jgi:HSP20 family protein
VKDSFRFFWEEPFDSDEPNIRIEVPGFRKDEITVNLSHSSLTINASKKDRKVEKGKGFYSEESFVSSFSKSVSLPHRIDPRGFDVVVEDGAVVLKKRKRARKNQH